MCFWIHLILNIIGPYSLNGVPLRRVNQKYAIATSTHVSLAGVNVDHIEDSFFAREANDDKGEEEKFFGAAKETVTSDARKAAQNQVDGQLQANIDKVDKLGAYLGAKFSLSRADKPHLMKF